MLSDPEARVVPAVRSRFGERRYNREDCDCAHFRFNFQLQKHWKTSRERAKLAPMMAKCSSKLTRVLALENQWNRKKNQICTDPAHIVTGIRFADHSSEQTTTEKAIFMF